jgi:hypothetical protein
MMDTEFYSQAPIMRGEKPNRFEARWFSEGSFNDEVQTAWENAGSINPSAAVLEKLTKLHQDLHSWDNRVLKKPKKRLRQAQYELEQLT